jgi:hypothetical protein
MALERHGRHVCPTAGGEPVMSEQETIGFKGPDVHGHSTGLTSL